MLYFAALWHLAVLNAPNLVGFALPPVVEFLNRDVQSEKERYIVALLVCFFAAILLHWNVIADGSPEQIAAFTGILFLESNSLFKLYFATTWIRQKIQGTTQQQEGEGPIAQTP